MFTSGSIVTSPPMALDFAARSGKRIAYDTIRRSCGFLRVSCILVETYKAASVTSWVCVPCVSRIHVWLQPRN